MGLYQELGDRLGIATALRNLGAQALNQGGYRQAKIYLQQSLELSRQLNDPSCTANTLLNLGLMARDQGDVPGPVSSTTRVWGCSERWTTSPASRS